MKARIARVLLCSVLLANGLMACTTADNQNPEDTFSDDDLDTAATAGNKEAKAHTANVLKSADDDVIDYAIADYKSFDPSGIVVHFEFDDARLSEKTIDALNKIVAGMKKDPLARVSVRGHADKQGTRDYNKSLSGRRAKAIEDYLIQHGVDSDRLNPVSMGDSDPVADGDTIATFKKNRRGDFTINYGPSAFGKVP